ncbi:MAG: hypothetical protein AAF945_08035 [Actinomycetota bacterium]
MRWSSEAPGNRVDLGALGTRLKDVVRRVASTDRHQLAAACSPRRMWVAFDPPGQLRHLWSLASGFVGVRSRVPHHHSALRNRETAQASAATGGITPSDTVSVVRSSLVLTWAAVSARVGTPTARSRLR